MKVLIDRGRWPVLVTYHDEGQGHVGTVYKCSGWKPTVRNKRKFYTDGEGKRVSSYSNGGKKESTLVFGGHTWLQRWEHWVCPEGQVEEHMSSAGWHRIPVPGKTWRSGNPVYKWENTKPVDAPETDR